MHNTRTAHRKSESAWEALLRCGGRGHWSVVDRVGSSAQDGTGERRRAAADIRGSGWRGAAPLGVNKASESSRACVQERGTRQSVRDHALSLWTGALCVAYSGIVLLRFGGRRLSYVKLPEERSVRPEAPHTLGGGSLTVRVLCSLSPSSRSSIPRSGLSEGRAGACAQPASDASPPGAKYCRYCSAAPSSGPTSFSLARRCVCRLSLCAVYIAAPGLFPCRSWTATTTTWS